MSSYNLMKRADRDRNLRDLLSEKDAILKGVWPRDTCDSLRWGATRVFSSDEDHQSYALQRINLGVDYLKNLQTRIESGTDPSLKHWEV